MLGAGTIAEHLADRQIQAMGLCFASTYVIYDVRLIQGLKLLKLRNPPGDHDEWKGDWSDKSELWTLRLKRKLDVQDVDDNCFWMSFDDFVNALKLSKPGDEVDVVVERDGERVTLHATLEGRGAH